MRDRFDYTSPCGLIGRLANRMFLQRYMTTLLTERNREIKELAESGGYTRFLTGGT